MTDTIVAFSSAIAHHPHLEFGLAATIVAWISVSWLLRRRKNDP